MATMKDIARLAKVSTSTVSHVINHSRFVSEEIRRRVLQVVDELNYTPSALARSLKIKQTQTIGMLVTATNNPFFAEVMAGVEQYCHQHQYHLIIATTDGDAHRLRQNLYMLQQKQVDGLLLMCADSRIHAGKALKINLPMVVMDWWYHDVYADKIAENSEYGGYLATKALLDAGHRRIGIITGSLKKSAARHRLSGYQQALRESGINPDPTLINEQHFDFAGGVAGMTHLLNLPHRPTAVFCCSDTIAIGAYQAAWQLGLHIPQDISVIGYDNIEPAKYLAPPLSTINQPKAELGRLAVETLLQRIKNPPKTNRTLLLEPQLIMRDSVRSCR